MTHKGQSRREWVNRYMGSRSTHEEYPNLADRVDSCERLWTTKRAAATHVFMYGGDEVLYTKSTFLLPESLIAKVKTLPESQRGQHQVRVTLRDGSTRDGVVLARQDFETYDDCEDVIADDIVDVTMND